MNTTDLEKDLQDAFQAQVEAVIGHGRVTTWSRGLDDLKRTPGNGKELVGAKQVLLRSDPERKIVGLIEGVLNTNLITFEQLRQTWMERSADPEAHAGPVPSLEEIAQAAAIKLARLWETGLPDPDKTRGYRLLLAYGNEHIWEQMNDRFGYDPRLLDGNDLAGWPTGMDPMHFRATRSQPAFPFLDLGIPDWIDKKNQGPAIRQAEFMRRGVGANEYTWMREYAIQTMGGRIEKADFTLFVHGLPVVWVEMKTQKRGLDVAAMDFQRKETYLRAPLRMLADGAQASLTAAGDAAFEQIPKWYVTQHPIGAGHGMPNGKAPGIDGGQAYLLGQVLTHPARFEFLIQQASAFNAQGRFLVARPQQYEALARWWRDLLWSACAGQKIGDRLIRHTQRTGKTHTMIRAIHMALAERVVDQSDEAKKVGRESSSSAFDMALLMVGETNIIDQIAKAFTKDNFGLLDVSVSTNPAQSRADFRKLIKEQREEPNTKRVVLANTQKLESLAATSMDGKRIAELMGEGAQNPIRALVVLDESHLSQNGQMADMRQLLLPNARHLLLTATPKNEMSRYYGITRPHHILDDFGYRQAQAAGMVVGVRFERARNTLNPNPEQLQQLSEAIGRAGDIKSACEHLDGVTDGMSNAERQMTVKAIIKRVEHDLVEDRLEAVVNKLDEIEDATGRDEHGQPLFRPRAMIFAGSINQGRMLIDWIQAQNRAAGRTLDHELNVFGGRRFGMDVSDFGHGDDNTLKVYNPGVMQAKTIKNRFESEDPHSRIDILIAVGKYTKGYDNADLCLVALLRAIREPSLINQIYTRPATRREGKGSGVCLDLALGLGNVTSWKQSLALYDRESELPLFDENGIGELLKTVESHLDGAAQAIDPHWTHADLGVPANLGRGVGVLKGKKELTSRFVMIMDQLCRSVERLPDAAVLAPLRTPLLGAKYILKQVRKIFPDLDRTHGGHGSANAIMMNDQALGERIDQALRILQVSSLRHFLDISHLEAQAINGDVPGSQAVQDVRVQAAAQNSIDAARALLEAHGGRRKNSPEDDEDPDGGDGQDENPSMALRIALEQALARLMDEFGKDDRGVGGRTRIEQEMQALREKMQAMRNSLPGGDFEALLTHQVREEFQRRWKLLDLPKNGQAALFSPLIETAGREWARMFKVWRNNNGIALSEVQAGTLAEMWINGLSAGQRDLLQWVMPVKETDAAWKARFEQFTLAHQNRMNDIRAAMGKSMDAAATRDDPSLLDMAVTKAGRLLGILEASDAWQAAQDDN